MKVLQAASSLYDWGGIERYVHYLDQGLTARNHEVLVVCPDHSPLAARAKHFASVSNRFKYSMRTYIGYRRVIHEWKPDIVHTHFSPDFLIPARVAKSAKSKCVMTRHLVLPWKPSRVNSRSSGSESGHAALTSPRKATVGTPAKSTVLPTGRAI